MQPTQLLTSDRPAPATASTPATSPSLSSPFISLSTQCDALYGVAAQPHRYAFLSEQSVYSRAAEQLRFWTPSPLQARPLPSSAPGVVASPSPQICVVAPANPPFPTLHWLEQARKAEAAAAAAATATSSTAQQRGHTTGPACGTARLQPLVSSGAAMAVDAFRSAFPFLLSSPPRFRTSEREGIAAAEATGHGSTLGVADVPPPPATPQASATLHFPSPVLLRAVAQMVATMQTSQQSTAARFALAQYRGVSLPVWRHAVEQSPSLATRADALAAQEALVLSVLPQVVADRCATKPSTGAQSSQESSAAAVFYSVSPVYTAEFGNTQAGRGTKRGREEGHSDGSTAPAPLAEPRVVPEAVRCARVSGWSLTADDGKAEVPLHYSAVSPETFSRLYPSSHASTPADADTTVYDEEAAWLTHAVFSPLFTFPGVPQSAEPAEPPTEEHRRSTHAAFVKTSAFLFLAFLVHHSWCLYIHDAVATALSARRGVTIDAVQVTCLPDLAAARRSPQHEWSSVLTYRFLQHKHSSNGGEHDTPSSNTAESALVGQITVRVVNRSAELTWRSWGRVVGTALGLASAPEDGSLRNGGAGSAAGKREGTGSLDALIQQL